MLAASSPWTALSDRRRALGAVSASAEAARGGPRCRRARPAVRRSRPRSATAPVAHGQHAVEHEAPGIMRWIAQTSGRREPLMSDRRRRRVRQRAPHPARRTYPARRSARRAGRHARSLPPASSSFGPAPMTMPGAPAPVEGPAGDARPRRPGDDAAGPHEASRSRALRARRRVGGAGHGRRREWRGRCARQRPQGPRRRSAASRARGSKPRSPGDRLRQPDEHGAARGRYRTLPGHSRRRAVSASSPKRMAPGFPGGEAGQGVGQGDVIGAGRERRSHSSMTFRRKKRSSRNWPRRWRAAGRRWSPRCARWPCA